MPRASSYPTLPVIFGTEKLLVSDSAGQTSDPANNVEPNVIKTFINAVEKSGSTMSGFLILNAPPTITLHAATKGYVDSVMTGFMPITGGVFTGSINGVTPFSLSCLSGATSNIQNQINSISNGLSWKQPGRIALSTNVTIASPGTTLDGMTMVAGDRVLLNGQSTGSENGVYVWNGFAVPMTRATDCSTASYGSTGIYGMVIAIIEGTFAQDAFMLITAPPIIIDTTPLSYDHAPFSVYTASNGIILTGSNFTLDNGYFSGAFTLSAGVATLANNYITTAMLATLSTTGTGLIVLNNSPTLITPLLGTPTSGILTNCTGLPVSTGIDGLGAGIAIFLATPSSTNLASAITDETGTGSLVFANTPTLISPLLGTPTSGNLLNCTGLPISSGVSGLGTGVATFLTTPSSANLASMLTDETGSGSAVFANTPTLISPLLGTPTSGILTNCTGLPISTGVSGLGLGIATFLATPTSANLRSALTDETGSGAAVFADTPTLITPILGDATATFIKNDNGAVGTPSYTFTSDTDTGFYSSGSNKLGVASAGNQVAEFNPSGFLIRNNLVWQSIATTKSGSSTATGAELFGGIISMTGGGGVNLTLDTATNIYAAMGSPGFVGATFCCFIVSTGGTNTTIVTNTGLTLVLGAATVNNNGRHYYFVVTDTATPTITVYGG